MILFELDFGHGELHRYARYNRQVPKHLIGKDIGCLWKSHIVRVRISKVECSETQSTLKTTIEFVGRLKNVLRINGVFDNLDMSYIKGEISEAEYVNQVKAQNECGLGDLFMGMFRDVPTKQ